MDEIGEWWWHLHLGQAVRIFPKLFCLFLLVNKLSHEWDAPVRFQKYYSYILRPPYKSFNYILVRLYKKERPSSYRAVLIFFNPRNHSCTCHSIYQDHRWDYVPSSPSVGLPASVTVTTYCCKLDLSRPMVIWCAGGSRCASRRPRGRS